MLILGYKAIRIGFSLLGLLFLLFVVGGFLLWLTPFGLPLLLLLCLAYGWLIYAFFHYRYGRQFEVVRLLIAAADANLPLAPTLRSYLEDRPETGWRKFWVIFLLFIALPGYYWVWHRRYGFDVRTKQLVHLLEQGTPLHQALEAVPGIVPSEVILGAAIGESTGRLGDCLRRSIRGNWGPLWLDVIPRFLYPLSLLFFVLSLASFTSIYIFPRMKRIFQEFHQTLPTISLWVDEVISRSPSLLGIATILGSIFFVLYLASPALRWWTPILGRVYRLSVQSRITGMLGMLLEAGRTVPESLELIAAREEPGALVWRRLQSARRRTEQGQSLSDSLDQVGLLPRAAVPLIQSAGRAGNLQWMLGELGEQLAARALQLSQRLSLIFFPISVVAIGLIVAAVALGLFMPLITLLGELSG